MTENVKFIFKSLIKVPIIIFVSYMVINLFAFTVSYFRMLGVSYVVLQTVIENNYLPYDPSGSRLEGNTLVDYVNSLETELLQDIIIGCDSVSGAGVNNCTDITAAGAESYNTKVQYGQPVNISVSAKYVWMLPLHKEDSGTMEADTSLGDGGLGNLGYEETDHNIVITYTVPGLKYYPDLN